MENNLEIKIDSKLENVAVVRVAITSMLASINVTLDQIMDIKTALSEAITNSIEHGYTNSSGKVIINAKLSTIDDTTYFYVEIEDNGDGIENIELAITPAYTTKPELEHAGMGFTIMETFMDEIQIDSTIGVGTKVALMKKISNVKV